MRRRTYLPTRSLPYRSGSDADRRQILEPALRLHEAVNIRRHGARIDVVRNKDQRRLLVHHLMQPGQQCEALLRVELAEDGVDHLVELGVAEMTPIAALGRPRAGPDMADQRIERI